MTAEQGVQHQHKRFQIGSIGQIGLRSGVRHSLPNGENQRSVSPDRMHAACAFSIPVRPIRVKKPRGKLPAAIIRLKPYKRAGRRNHVSVCRGSQALEIRERKRQVVDGDTHRAGREVPARCV